jgi:hypothetical protein
MFRGGKDVPKWFQKASCESGSMHDGEIPSRVPRNWDDRIALMRRDPEAGAMPLRKEDEVVLTKVIAAAFVIEPAARATTEAAILAMLQHEWETAVTPVENLDSSESKRVSICNCLVTTLNPDVKTGQCQQNATVRMQQQ